jgi:hypothetical protein
MGIRGPEGEPGPEEKRDTRGFEMESVESPVWTIKDLSVWQLQLDWLFRVSFDRKLRVQAVCQRQSATVSKCLQNNLTASAAK